MRTIIAGSRAIDDYTSLVLAIAQCPWQITTVLSGHADGVDRLGERWALSRNIPVELYPADWKTHGRVAGLVRNIEMACRAQALVAVWDGESNGTKHMIRVAEKYDLKIFVVRH